MSERKFSECSGGFSFDVSQFSFLGTLNGLDMSGYPEVLALRGLYDARTGGERKESDEPLDSDLP